MAIRALNSDHNHKQSEILCWGLEYSQLIPSSTITRATRFVHLINRE